MSTTTEPEAVAFEVINADTALPPAVVERVKAFQALSNKTATFGSTTNLPEDGKLDEATQRRLNKILELQSTPVSLKSIADATEGQMDIIMALIVSMNNQKANDPANFSPDEETTRLALMAAHDVIAFKSQGEIVNTHQKELEQAKAQAAFEADDSFFKGAKRGDFTVYDAFKARNQRLENEALAKMGYPNGREDVAKEAQDRFYDKLAEAGIAPSDATKAILSGTLSPNLTDIKLIYEGFGRPEPADIRQNYPHILKMLHENGLVSKPPEEMTDADIANIEDYKIQGVINQYRQSQWNAKFGSLESAVGITTVLNGEVRPLTQADVNAAASVHAMNVVSFIYQDTDSKNDYLKLRNMAQTGGITPSMDPATNPEFIINGQDISAPISAAAPTDPTLSPISAPNPEETAPISAASPAENPVIRQPISAPSPG